MGMVTLAKTTASPGRPGPAQAITPQTTSVPMRTNRTIELTGPKRVKCHTCNG